MSSVSSVLRDRFLGCEGEGEGERGERGKRGKRGKRGHRGHSGHDGHDGRDGATGPTGPTGPTGMTGSTGLLAHVEDSIQFAPLPPNTTTTILTTAPMIAPAGSMLQFTAMVNWTALGLASSNAPTMVAILVQDAGTPGAIGLATCFTSAGAVARGGGVFDFFACIPIAWWRVSDGLPHTYSVQCSTDGNPSQQVQTCALFVNNLP